MKINTLRTSFVFTETILDLQRGSDPARPLNIVASQPGYISCVEKLRKGVALPLDLDFPWDHPDGQHFWERYLDEKRPRDADGKLCFQQLLPLRLPLLAGKIAVKAPGLALSEQAKLRVEGYYYPFGTGLIVTWDLTGKFDIDRAGQLAMALRHDKIYQPNWAPDDVGGPMTLDQLATEALDRLRRRGFGSAVSGWRNDPFSIATVLLGEGVDANKLLVPQEPAHRLLNGLANWDRDWSQLRAPDLVSGATNLRIWGKTRRPGHMLFAGSQGRAVWFPGLFLPSATKHRALSCYHRNLTFAALQTESLLALAREVNAEMQQAATKAVPNAIQQLGRRAAGLLARLYTRSKTYNSDSVRAQIAQSRWFADVDALRKSLGVGLPLDVKVD